MQTKKGPIYLIWKSCFDSWDFCLLYQAVCSSFQQLNETCLLCKSGSRRPTGVGTWENISHNITTVRQCVGSQVFSWGQSFSRHPHFKRHTDGATSDLNRAFFAVPQCISFIAAFPGLQVIRMSKCLGQEHLHKLAQKGKHTQSTIP